MRPTHLLYLHGFRSSPASTKARRMAQWVREHRPDLHWACPQLPASPAQALQEMLRLVGNWPHDRTALIGSSLGGFYATVLAERLGCPAALLNPAVDPARDLAGQVGEHTLWHDPAATLVFRPEFIAELAEMTPMALTHPQRYFALIAQGDEVLDWREMAARYAGTTLRVIEGSDHALSNFEAHLAAVVRFLKL